MLEPKSHIRANGSRRAQARSLILQHSTFARFKLHLMLINAKHRAASDRNCNLKLNR